MNHVLSCSTPTSSVLRVVPPVRQVDLRRPCDHQLQLAGIEHGHQPRIHHLVGGGEEEGCWHQKKKLFTATYQFLTSLTMSVVLKMSTVPMITLP